MHFQTIYCDIDDVLANFAFWALKVHARSGRQLPYDYGELAPHHVSRILGTRTVSHYLCPGNDHVTDFWSPVFDRFWAPIRVDPFFWHHIPVFEWTHDLLKLLEQHCDEVIYLTTPDRDPSSYSGKYAWVAWNKLPEYQMVMAYEKYRLADPDCLLIDDKLVHCQQWHGRCMDKFSTYGNTILFPAGWNQNRVVRNPLAFVRSYLQR